MTDGTRNEHPFSYIYLPTYYCIPERIFSRIQLCYIMLTPTCCKSAVLVFCVLYNNDDNNHHHYTNLPVFSEKRSISHRNNTTLGYDK